jgi:hypothetical protein
MHSSPAIITSSFFSSPFSFILVMRRKLCCQQVMDDSRDSSGHSIAGKLLGPDGLIFKMTAVYKPARE